MKRKVWKQVLAATFCFILFFGTMTVQAEETIKHSTVDYDASFYDAITTYQDLYISREKIGCCVRGILMWLICQRTQMETSVIN